MVILEKKPKRKICLDLIGPTTLKKDRHKFNTLLKPFSINPPAQKVYIMHKIAMAITNLVDISCKIDYNPS